MRCCAHIGCIKYLEEIGAIGHIKNFVGASAGSLIAFFACLGYSSVQMERAIKNYIASQNDGAVTATKVENLFNLYSGLGVDDCCHLRMFLEERLDLALGSKSLTFVEFTKATGRNLVISACRLRDMESTFFNIDATPNCNVIDAMLGSIAIPIIFKPQIINGEYYIDGGFVNNFPFDYYSRSSVCDTLGIQLYPAMNTSSADECYSSMNLLNLVNRMLVSMIKKINQHRGAPGKNICVLTIPLDGLVEDANTMFYDVHELAFKISDETIVAIIERGYKCMRDMLERTTMTPDAP